MLVGDPGVLDVVVVLVAPLDALLSPEVLVGAGALLRVAHLVVEGRAGTTSTPVGRPGRWTRFKKKKLNTDSYSVGAVLPFTGSLATTLRLRISLLRSFQTPVQSSFQFFEWVKTLQD